MRHSVLKPLFLRSLFPGRSKRLITKITPATIALFHTNYIINKSLGKFGKWVRRPNKLEFKQNII